ncbi:MAG TPA: VTT domain-containing protein [Ruminiclostridium sp.]
MERKVRKTLVKYILLALSFVGVLIFISIKYTPFIVSTISNTEKFRDFILSYGNKGVLVFIFFQLSHIIIPVIPGELVQIAGGYVYGTIFGSIFLLFGTVIGTIIVFYVSRIIGYPIVEIFVSKEKMKKFVFLANSGKIEVVMFILFLIPGMPKDALIYIAALTPIRPVRFIAISLVARTPGIIGSAFIGANMLEKDYKSAIIMAIISLLIFTIGIVFRKKILSSLNREPSYD